MEQEVGGSSPPNCTNEINRITFHPSCPQIGTVLKTTRDRSAGGLRSACWVRRGEVSRSEAGYAAISCPPAHRKVLSLSYCTRCFLGENMRRREFITLLGGVGAWRSAAPGQPIKNVPKVGVLWHAANTEEEAIGLAALTRGFSDLGYIEGKTIALQQMTEPLQAKRICDAAQLSCPQCSRDR